MPIGTLIITCPRTGRTCENSGCYGGGRCPYEHTFAPIPSIGWLCPRCGRGNAPGTSTCPCVPPDPLTVTC